MAAAINILVAFGCCGLAIVNRPSFVSSGDGVERGGDIDSLGSDSVEAELPNCITPSLGESMESGGECVEWR